MAQGIIKMQTPLQNQTLANTNKNCAKTFKTLHICTCTHKLTLSYTQFPTALLMSTPLKLHETWGEES